MELIGEIWNGVIIRPMINSLVLLYYIFFSNFGLAIIAFTIIVRTAMIPLTLKQSRLMKAMSQIQPDMKKIQERYPKDKARAQQEIMRLYKERGVNPLSCLGPMVIQMPIFIGLFWALRGTLPSTPERLADLSRHLYSWIPQVHQAVPLDGGFIGMDLAVYAGESPAPFNLLLPVLVGGSMWVMQKMTTVAPATPQQASTNRLMLWMMPLMFGFFTLNFESGLALYWIVSNLIGIVIQGFITGWGPLESVVRFGRASAAKQPSSDAVPSPASALSDEEVVTGENNRNDRKDAGRGNRNRSKRARRRARGGRNRRR